MLPYDGSVRIPFIMRYPDQLKAGSEDTRFIDINDILPTVLDVAGVPCPNPERLPGESIFAVDGRKDRTVEYVEHSHGKLRWISLITKSYNNPPLFPKRQEGDYISLEEEVKRAVAHEDVVKLEELDIPYYEERCVLSREKL